MNKQPERTVIEDYLPIEAISEEASREKSLRKRHISTLHLWWARRPLVASRAAVFGALVPILRFQPANGNDERRPILARANAARFMQGLCKYAVSPSTISDARKHIIETHAERIAGDTGSQVTDTVPSAATLRPKVLDMFAGGGAIPLEALRLGCEAYALDLNPVAHIIELATLVYPQRHGKPDNSFVGSGRHSRWAGLAAEVQHWGQWCLTQAESEVGDLYPTIGTTLGSRSSARLWRDSTPNNADAGLTPIAYLWTRIVSCKNPTCQAEVPLMRQTWLCKKQGRYTALKVIADRQVQTLRFEVVRAVTAESLGFNPAHGSKAGNAICHFCGSTVDGRYVKEQARTGRMREKMMAIVCVQPGIPGKVYLSADGMPPLLRTDLESRLQELSCKYSVAPPDEAIESNPRSMDTQNFGFKTWGDLFGLRQKISLIAFAGAIQKAESAMCARGYYPEKSKAIVTALGLWLDRLADKMSTLTRWDNSRENSQGTFGRQSLPMVWDYVEPNPFGNASGSAASALEWITAALSELETIPEPATVVRGSAMALPWDDRFFDAVVTDPPYYDNVSYSNLSDFFYVWLKRTVGKLYPEHFAAIATPKKNEAIAAFYRHGGDPEKARQAYELAMRQAFKEANRVLKPAGQMVVVYAHKTTLGWTTLVDSLRQAGFTVIEAWPVDTEMKSRLIARDTASLASSIFLATRKRTDNSPGYYDELRPELEQIVRERVSTLWDLGVSGADLVIACIGAGLRAFTRNPRIEYGNGQEMPSARFLAEVETTVLDAILSRLSKSVSSKPGQHGLEGVDPITRFYMLWRYTYGAAELSGGDAIVFANGTHIELNTLSSSPRPLLENKKGKYRLLDYQQRGEDQKLGASSTDGGPAAVIDSLHRLLWLVQNRPRAVADFIRDSHANMDQIRLVAQALLGPTLKGTELFPVGSTDETNALARLTANWEAIVSVAEAEHLPPKRHSGRAQDIASKARSARA